VLYFPPVRSSRHVLPVWAALLAAVAVGSLFLGRYPAGRLSFVSPALFFQDAMTCKLVLNLRLPRILMAAFLGMSLASGGAVMQRLFRNPLVDPGFLGVSGGAAFGAGLALLCGAGSALVLEGSAALFALLGLAASCLLARRIRIGGWVLRLVLSGIVVSAFFSAALGLLKTWADPLKVLPELTFWLLGGLWGVTWADVSRAWPVVLPALALLWAMRWRTAVLALDDRTLFSLGLRGTAERLLVLFAASVAVAATVAVCGAVGWLGLIVPHVARRMPGTDARNLLPVAMLLGGILGILCDDIARTLAPAEIPVGILTSLLGASVFLALLLRSRPRAVDGGEAA
jgi:iron complex transport system permease protein